MEDDMRHKEKKREEYIRQKTFEMERKYREL
jgi:hypothetical protein